MKKIDLVIYLIPVVPFFVYFFVYSSELLDNKQAIAAKMATMISLFYGLFILTGNFVTRFLKGEVKLMTALGFMVSRFTLSLAIIFLLFSGQLVSLEKMDVAFFNLSLVSLLPAFFVTEIVSLLKESLEQGKVA